MSSSPATPQLPSPDAGMIGGKASKKASKKASMSSRESQVAEATYRGIVSASRRCHKRHHDRSHPYCGQGCILFLMSGSGEASMTKRSSLFGLAAAAAIVFQACG